MSIPFGKTGILVERYDMELLDQSIDECRAAVSEYYRSGNTEELLREVGNLMESGRRVLAATPKTRIVRMNNS